MGLAASQGRFLLLTSRQSDVELQMQTITNQKLALMRQQSSLSAQHASAMNAQNVMWQPSEDQDPVELQYQNFMYQGSGYTLTNAYGAVMLDGSSALSKQIIAALKIDPANYPNGMTGAQFLAAAGDEKTFLKNFVTSSVAGKKFDETITADDKIEALLRDKNLVDMSSTGNGNSLFETSYDDDLIKQIAFAENGAAGMYQVNTKIQGSKTGTVGFCLKDVLTVGLDRVFTDMNGKDVGYKDVNEAREYMNSNAKNVSDTIKNATSNIKAITSHMTEALATVLCGGSALGTDYPGYLKDFETQIRQACAWAEQATVNKFIYSVNDQESRDQDSEVTGHKAGLVSVNDNGNNAYAEKESNPNKASNNLDFVYAKTSTSSGGFFSGGKQTATAFEAYTQIDQEQVADTFLSYFDLYCEQHFSPNSIGDNITGNTVDTTHAEEGKESKANIVTDTITYRGYEYYDEALKKDKHVGGTSGSGHCTINGVAVGEGEGLDATGAYWLKMFEQMKTYGIQFNSNLSDSDYLQQQMLYGNVSMKKLDGYRAEGHHNVSINDSNSPMFLQDDEKAIEEETRRYDMESDAIAFKETLLDSMLQDLEAERDAITTEKDSVKKIIENNVKKFKLFC